MNHRYHPLAILIFIGLALIFLHVLIAGDDAAACVRTASGELVCGTEE